MALTIMFFWCFYWIEIPALTGLVDCWFYFDETIFRDPENAIDCTTLISFFINFAFDGIIQAIFNFFASLLYNSASKKVNGFCKLWEFSCFI